MPKKTDVPENNGQTLYSKFDLVFNIDGVCRIHSDECRVLYVVCSVCVCVCLCVHVFAEWISVFVCFYECMF